MANSILELLDILPICLIGISEHKQEPICRPAGYVSCQLSLCTGGNGVFIDENKETHLIQKGDLFFFRSNIPHEYYPIDSTWQIFFVVFNGADTAKILDYIGFEKTNVIHLGEKYSEILNSMNELYTANYALSESRFKLTSAMMYSLVVRISDFLKHSVKKHENKKAVRLAPVLEMMNIHISEDIGLTQMAQCINISENQLGRLFNEVYGMSPMTILKNMRMEFAKHFLMWYPTRKIKDIAASVGYKDSSYFCSVFKREFGLTPEEFREAARGF